MEKCKDDRCSQIPLEMFRPSPFIYYIRSHKIKWELKKQFIRLGKAMGPRLQLILLAIGLILLSNFLQRLIFFIYNSGSATAFSATDAIKAFFVGIRFDLATFAILQGWLILLLALPFSFVLKPRFLKIWALLVAIMQIPVVLLNGTDVVYYGYSSKRLTHELFSQSTGDLANFKFSDYLPYWWLILLSLALPVFIYAVLRRRSKKLKSPPQATKRQNLLGLGRVLVMAGLLFLAFRGGLQNRPLRPANAFVVNSMFLANVGLNSTYTVLSSLDLGKEELIRFMEPDVATQRVQEMVKNDFDQAYSDPDYPLLRQAEFPGPEKRYNVVIILMESMNATKTGAIQGLGPAQSLTPNFDRLAQKGRLFTNFHASGSRSIESLPAVLNGMPEIFTRPTIGSSYETNTQFGLGRMLQQRGYHTSFFCGGPNGTMGFDSYSRLSGFTNYFGWDDFPADRQEIAGNWGLHDRPVGRWMADLQKEFPKPFVSAWFTISNHFPFDTPEDCPDEIKSRELSEMDRTVMYADYALGEYFEQIQSQDWADSTIFVITADHCFYPLDDQPENLMGSFHVPLLLIGPGVEPGVDSRLGSHTALLPTLIELLRLDTRHASASVSLFSKNRSPVSVNNMMGVVTLARDSVSYSTNFENVMPCHLYQNNEWVFHGPLQKGEIGNQMDQDVRAYYQVFQNLRVVNKLVDPRLLNMNRENQ